MKFVDGLMIHSGDPVNDYVDSACRHVLLRQGVLGIKVCPTLYQRSLFTKPTSKAIYPILANSTQILPLEVVTFLKAQSSANLPW